MTTVATTSTPPKLRRRRWRRVALWSAAGLAVLLIAGYLLLQHTLRTRILAATEKTLGCPATLGDVSLSPDGTLTLEALAIANPPDYPAAPMLDLPRCTLRLRLRSLLSRTVEVDEITLDGLTLRVVQKNLGTNLAVVLNHINEPDETPEPAAEPKRYAVQRVVLTHVTALATVIGPDGTAKQIAVPLQHLELERPVDKQGNLMPLGSLIGHILKQVAREAMQDRRMPVAMRAAGDAALASMGQRAETLLPGLKTVMPAATQAARGLMKNFQFKRPPKPDPEPATQPGT